MTIGTSTFIRDSVLFIRDTLLTITDPISSSRTGDEKFVMTAYPERAVKYPIITVKQLNVTDGRPLGMQSEGRAANVEIEVRVWARTNNERDTIFQSVHDKLRSIQLDATTGSVAVGLYNFTLLSAVPVDEPSDSDGKAGIHSTVAMYKYLVILN